jgi:hypothetical protein
VKGLIELLSSVIITLLVIIAAITIITVGLPLIQEARERGIINEAQNNMQLIDSLIKDVASQGTGSLKTVKITVSGGTYRVDSDSNSFDFDLDLSKPIFSLGTFTEGGGVQTSTTGTAIASQNSTHLKLENEILEVVQPKVGSETSFDGINTSVAISYMRLKGSNAVVSPSSSGITIGGFQNTSWGLGYSKLVAEGSSLAYAESLFHVKSNLTNTEYEVLYSLPASADFLIVNVRNISSTNQTTAVLVYKLGTTESDDVIKIGDINETAPQ